MKQKQVRKELLLKTLDQFGLNPKEWSLREQEQMPCLSSVLLVHKGDPHFRLLGETNKKGWLNIQVFSV